MLSLHSNLLQPFSSILFSSCLREEDVCSSDFVSVACIRLPVFALLLVILTSSCNAYTRITKMTHLHLSHHLTDPSMNLSRLSVTETFSLFPFHLLQQHRVTEYNQPVSGFYYCWHILKDHVPKIQRVSLFLLQQAQNLIHSTSPICSC